ncbi:polymorphic outer membrane protein [Planoprotostelium fungivorum]|uniref:Polymorphic outer membrane protein n=1 Tax=Planoprotostelium fungivorum TaxID=1890364 RepID=A0A2P6NA53_9EUKA|nr:polymorphic outer membrane protein [Planoprotostelium fungivorum]
MASVMRLWIVGLFLVSGYAQTIYTSPGTWSSDISSADASGYQSITVVLQDGVYLQNVAFGNVPSWNFIASASGTIVSGSLTATKSLSLTLSGITFSSSISSSLSIDLVVNNCNFFNSTSGAISVWGNVMVSGCTFNNNTIVGSGSAIKSIGGSVSVFSSTFVGQNGSAVYIASGSLQVSNSVFRYNRGSGASGSAIFTTGSPTTVNGCTFFSNSAGTGGSISTTSGQLVLSSSTFQYEQAGNGSSVAVQSSSVVVTNSTFSGGVATNNGGAIYGTTSLVVIRGSQFTNMSAAQGGALSFSTSTNVTVADTAFTANTAKNGAGIDIQGSGIPNYLTLLRCSFTSNTFITSSYVGSSGAALRAQSSVVSAQNSTFYGNLANNAGGVHLSSSTGTFDYCTFNGNMAFTGGAVTLQSTSTINVTRSNFSNNKAGGWTGVLYNFNSSGYGGAISVQITSTAYLDGCTFDGNAASYGAAIITDQNTNVRLTNSTLSNNVVGIIGGALCISGAVVLQSDTFTLNSATSKGGAIYLNPTNLASVTASSLTFNSNSAQYGGALFSDAGSSFTLSAASFSNNYGSVMRGGSVFVNGTGTIDQSTFTSNGNSSTDGGVVGVTSASLTVKNSVFTNNYASSVLSCTSCAQGFSAQNISLYSNTILGNGVVSLVNTNFAIQSMAINNNYGALIGGGLNVNGVRNGTIDGLTMSLMTTSTVDANAALLVQNSGNINLTNSVLQNIPFSAILCSQSNLMYMRNVTVVNTYNVTAQEQGAVGGFACSLQIDQSNLSNNSFKYAAVTMLNSDSLSVSNSVLSNNKALSNGAAVYSTAGVTFLTSNSFYNNTSPSAGGAVASNQAHLTNNTFIYNRSGSQGGAILFAQGGTSTNNLYINNTGGSGGAISCVTGSLLARGDTFITNSAINFGGALQIVSSTFTILSSTFINNTASTGGAICPYGSKGTVFSSTFSGNTGTLVVLGSTVEFHSITVTGSNSGPYTDASVLLVSSGRATMINSNIYSNNLPKTAATTYIIQVEDISHFCVVEDAQVDDGTLTVVGGSFLNNSKQALGVISASTVTVPSLAGYSTPMGYVSVMMSGTNLATTPYFYP